MDLLLGKGGSKKYGLILEEARAVLSPIQNQSARPQLLNDGSRPAEVLNPGKHSGFSLVNHQGIDRGQSLLQIFGLALNPVIHRVAGDDASSGELLANVELERGINIAKKNEFRIQI